MSVIPAFRVILKVVDHNAEMKVRLQMPVMVGRTDPISGFTPDIDLDKYGGHEAGVSRRHLILIPDIDGFLVKDLDTANGTFINGVELKPGILYPLKSGDELRLAHLTLIVTYRELVMSGELTLKKNQPARRLTNPLGQPSVIIKRHDPETKQVVHWAKRSMDHLTADQKKAIEILRQVIVNRDINDRMLMVIASRANESPYWKENKRLAVLQAASEYGYVARDNAELMKEQRRINDIRFNVAE